MCGLQRAALAALMAGGASGFVLPQASFNGLRAGPAAATRAASSLRMAEEPLGVGVIGCGRIGDVSSRACVQVQCSVVDTAGGCGLLRNKEICMRDARTIA